MTTQAPTPTSADPSLSPVAGTEERAADGDSPFDRLMQVDAACVEYGMPALSDWWRWSLGDFYASGKTWGIFHVGRGGGKSTSLERVAGSDAYYVKRNVPPGQVWTWPFISIGPDDANRRVDGISAVYHAMGLAFVGDETGEEDEKGKPVKVKDGEGVSVVHSPRAALSLKDFHGNTIKLMSIAGTIGNISGPSTIGLTVDEAAKLHDKSEHVNPLTEIIASGAQTSRGRAGWRAIVCSSAWEQGGTHAELAERGDTETNFVARIGERFLPAALYGFEAVAQWEEARGDHDAAKRIRAHAKTLTARSHMIPTWVANPTIGNPCGEPWDGAALATRMLAEVLPDKSLEGVPRIVYWLRENGSLPMAPGAGKPGPLAGVEFPTQEAVPDTIDTVVGLATHALGWAKIRVCATANAFVVDVDYTGSPMDRFSFIPSGTSVIACASDQERAVAADAAAWLLGAPWAHLPPVAPQAIYDGGVLRLGPLRTLYESGRLRHSPGLETLEKELLVWHEDSDRSPRLEALLAAVTRLVSCYPWLGGETESKPWKVPKIMGTMLDRDDGEADMARKMGGL